MSARGRPRKLGTFEISNFFVALIERGSFVEVADLVADRGLIVEDLSAPSIRRLLEQVGIKVGQDKVPDPGGPERRVSIQACEWKQPVETRDRDKHLFLWRILTGKGLMAFMLTRDDSADALERVARAAACRLGSRKRRVVTNHGGLYGALRSELVGWPIEKPDDS